MEIRKGDIVEYAISGITEGDWAGIGMVIDAQLFEHYMLSPDVVTELVIVRDFKRDKMRTFGKRYITKIIKCREDIEKFWEYL